VVGTASLIGKVRFARNPNDWRVLAFYERKRRCTAELNLRRRTENYLVHIHIGGLLDREAIARAIASGGIANLSRDSASLAFSSGFVSESAKFVRTKPGEMIVTRSDLCRASIGRWVERRDYDHNVSCKGPFLIATGATTKSLSIVIGGTAVSVYQRDETVTNQASLKGNHKQVLILGASERDFHMFPLTASLSLVKQKERDRRNQMDEKAGLRQDAVRSQVIDVLGSTRDKETGNEGD
jgi:hypothetical protein